MHDCIEERLLEGWLKGSTFCSLVILGCSESFVHLHPACTPTLEARHYKLTCNMFAPNSFIRSSPQTVDAYNFSIISSRMFFSSASTLIEELIMTH